MTSRCAARELGTPPSRQPAGIAHAVLELAGNGYSTGDVRTVEGGARLV